MQTSNSHGCRLALLGALFAVTLASRAAELPVASGPFRGSMDSLTNYTCPAWFRDAKFGIWAHWGPQAVPMAGDWYAKHMFVPGHPQYKHHLEQFGHPSTNGYVQIIEQWKAEQWDPDRLMALYKKAGARYFVSMGTHHDNFFLWNSKLHRWNAVNFGPRRDVVGAWQEAARKQGLRFGVSEHLGASFTWWQDSHKADKEGPLAGVPYQGADPALQDLYHFPAEPGDTAWYSKNPRWQRMWFDRIQELVDAYQPDLLYTDGGVAFGNDVGLSLVAHLYNQDAARRGGQPEVIYTCKQKSEGRWIEDLERGVMPGINPYPWQTDTSIGDWFYNRNWKFRPVTWTIHMLVDIVSKNGNLLLNIVQRPDGSLDPEVEQALETMATWIQIHGEAIYGTRPWQIHGEGPVRAKGGNFKEDFAYSARDIRFTTRGPVLYATALGWPADGRLRIRTLARTADPAANRIRSIELLGQAGALRFEQTPEALEVVLPLQHPSDITCCLRIQGDNLTPAPLPDTAVVAEPDASGHYVLRAEDAVLHGDQIQQEERSGKTNIGFWDKPGDWVSWNLRAPGPGTFRVSAECAAANAGTRFVVELGSQRVSGRSADTGGWETFKPVEVGEIRIPQAGNHTIAVRAADLQDWRALNLRSVRLSRTGN